MAAVVLAAGGASRMGRPKQLLCWRGESLVRRAARAALEAGCRPVVVVTGAAAPAVEAELRELDVCAVRNPAWQEGLGTSIARGVDEILGAGAPDGLLVMLADQPLASTDVLRALIDAFDGSPCGLVASGYGGGAGVPALFGRDHLAALQRRQGDRGARALFESAGGALRVVPFEDGAIDVDTPADYDRLCERS